MNKQKVQSMSDSGMCWGVVQGAGKGKAGLVGMSLGRLCLSKDCKDIREGVCVYAEE